MVGTSQSSLRDEHALPALQELVGHTNGCVQLAAGISALFENQTFLMVLERVEAV